MEINNEILFGEIERMIETFQMLLIKINQKEVDRTKDLNLIRSESQIILIVGQFMKDHERIEKKIQFIKGKVEKPWIKISFFGTVSAGKSRVLNTILGENLFLSAVTDTTSCFVKVNQSNDECHYIQHDNSGKCKCNSMEEIKTKVKELSTHLGGNSGKKLDTKKSVELFLNIQNNKILQRNTQIVDTPGCNNKDNVTSCIKEQSLDSDIFIYVMTYTLTSQEKEFFSYQSTLSSKPDVFILVNKWDKSDNDKRANTEKSKEKITNELTNLLVRECNFSKEEARKRIYFVSALEMYRSRVEKCDIFAKKNCDAVRFRYEEFIRCEDDLSNYIKNPEENKLNRHNREVTDIRNQLIKTRDDFKAKLLKIENCEKKNNELLINLQISLTEMKMDLKKIINKRKENINNNITRKFQEIKEYINRNNLQEINNKLNIIPNNVNRDLIDLQNISKESMREIKAKFEEKMGKYDPQNKKKKPTLTDDLKKNIVLKMIPERSVLSNIWGFVKSVFGNNDYEEEVSNIMRENIAKVDLNNEEINDYVKEYFDNLENYVKTESENMIDFVNERLDYILSYWTDLKKSL